MPEALAEGGVICINYPEGVLLPGEPKADNGDKKSKGINDLGNREIGVLLKSFDDERLPIQFLPVQERKGGQYVMARDAGTDKNSSPIAVQGSCRHRSSAPTRLKREARAPTLREPPN
jgi:hypothetical protein